MPGSDESFQGNFNQVDVLLQALRESLNNLYERLANAKQNIIYRNAALKEGKKDQCRSIRNRSSKKSSGISRTRISLSRVRIGVSRTRM